VSGAPDMIAGYAVGLDNAMDHVQSATSSPPVTKYTIAFGPMKKYLCRFRLAEKATKRNRGYVTRIEQAAKIFDIDL